MSCLGRAAPSRSCTRATPDAACTGTAHVSRGALVGLGIRAPGGQSPWTVPRVHSTTSWPSWISALTPGGGGMMMDGTSLPRMRSQVAPGADSNAVGFGVREWLLTSGYCKPSGRGGDDAASAGCTGARARTLTRSTPLQAVTTTYAGPCPNV